MSHKSNSQKCRELLSDRIVQQSKHNASAVAKKDKVFYEKTAQQYIKEGARFLTWNSKHYPKDKLDYHNAEELKPRMVEYLRDKMENGTGRNGNSKPTAQTLQRTRCALQKIWQVNLKPDTQFLPKRTTNSVKGRNTDPFKHYSCEKYGEQFQFYRAVGVRPGEYRFLSPAFIDHHKEDKEKGKYLTVQANPLGYNLVPHYDRNGNVVQVTTVIGKHGRTNTTWIVPEFQSLVTKVFADKNLLREYSNPSKDMNVYSFRREHAQDLYYAFLEKNGYGTQGEYCCRDGSGLKYDKAALTFVAQNLGHDAEGNGGRCFDVVHSYMR